MNAYHRILSSHFTNAEIQTLLDIFPYLRTPSYRELGFQLLKGANLYDSFFHFIVQYATIHKLDWYNEADLWNFMFSNEIRWTSDSLISGTSIFSERGNIVLPPFATGLDLISWGYENCENSILRKYYKITISNTEDIDYPIQIDYFIGNDIELPKTTYAAHIRIVGEGKNVTRNCLLHLYKNVPKTIKSISLNVSQNLSKLELGKSLRQFGELENLEFKHIQSLYKIHEIGFPPTLKSVDFRLEMGDKFPQMLLNCINECPNLTSIVLRTYHSQPYLNEIFQLLADNSFKLLESYKKRLKITYQFVK